MSMKIKIWGARGSHMASGVDYLKYGGNSPCIEVSSERSRKENEYYFFDGGSGLGFAGLALAKVKNSVSHICLTHMHPDHIFSLPHFMPLYSEGNQINIYISEKYYDVYLKKTGVKIDLNYVMSRPYYPIAPEKFPSKPELFIVPDDFLFFNDFTFQSYAVEHYEGATIYKIINGSKSFIYAPDVADVAILKKETVDFCRGADLLIWDSLYAPYEINNITRHKHSAFDSVITLAKAAEVPEILFFHHSPLKIYKELGVMEVAARELSGKIKSQFARDGMIIEL